MGVEEEAIERWKTGRGGRCAVESVTDDCVVKTCQVYADLVRAPRSDAHFEEAEPPSGKFFQDSVLRQRGSAGSQARGHPSAVNWVARNGRGDATASLLQGSVHKRKIGFLNGPFLELFRKLPMGGIGSSNEKNAAGFFVEPVNDTWAQLAVDRGQSSEVMQKSVDESAAVVAGSSMDYHTGGLIYRDDVVVFIQNA